MRPLYMIKYFDMAAASDKTDAEFIATLSQILTSSQLMSVLIRKIFTHLYNYLPFLTSFVAYKDHFGRPRTISIDSSDAILPSSQFAIDSLVNNLNSVTDYFEPAKTMFRGTFAVHPIKWEDRNLGLVGLKFKDGVPKKTKLYLTMLANMLASRIFFSNRLESEKDQRELIRSMDSLTDRSSPHSKDYMAKVLDLAGAKLNAPIGMIFNFDLNSQFTKFVFNETAKIVWDNYDNLRNQVTYALQECLESDEIVLKEVSGSGIVVADYRLESIVALPLKTSALEYAGLLVFVGKEPLTPEHLEIVKTCATFLDTCIIRYKKEDLLGRRLNKYFGRDILGHLIKNQEWLNPRKESVSILSADLAGSTDFANSEPDAMVVFNHINEYLTTIARVVREDFKGTLDKYIGDEVMALFGAPIKDRNSVSRCLDCGLEILRAVERLKKKHEKQGKIGLEVKVTINVAPVIVGELGSWETQLDYTAIGDGVNQTFRIAEYGLCRKVIVHENVYQCLKDSKYKFELLDSVAVRGIKNKINIYTCLGVK